MCLCSYDTSHSTGTRSLSLTWSTTAGPHTITILSESLVCVALPPPFWVARRWLLPSPEVVMMMMVVVVVAVVMTFFCGGSVVRVLCCHCFLSQSSGH